MKSKSSQVYPLQSDCLGDNGGRDIVDLYFWVPAFFTRVTSIMMIRSNKMGNLVGNKRSKGTKNEGED